tara:strand:+ start:780 stop:1307 length:528 start_codon:yes stop_codon:yes gene_type:complete
MIISRKWAMPNSETFTIKPIRELIERYIKSPPIYGGYILDPFVRNSVFKWDCSHTNDLNPEFEADYHEDALDFLQRWKDDDIHCVLFDPPYSPRQVSECYQNVGRTVTMKDTQASFWGDLKKEIGRIVKKNGVVISCGWNSGGMGKTNGFEIEEILLVPHGGWHNDTIVTVERKQ